MFKSLSLKISAMFVLLTISVIILIGTFMTDTTDRYYHDEFKNINNKVFSSDYVESLCLNIASSDGAAKIFNSVSAYSGQLGIDSYRNYFLLDGKTGKAIGGYASNADMADSLEISANIITAMNGEPGDKVSSEKNYMDFAVPINANEAPAYIVYVKDTKNEITSITRNILFILIEALLLSVIIAVVLSYLFSRTITKPIRVLTKSAERIASGEFEHIDRVKANDEIGILSNTFGYMSSALQDTIKEVNSEKNKIETILSNMTDGILAFNLSGELIHINPEAKKMIGRQYYDDIRFDAFFKEIDADINIGKLIYLNDKDNTERQATIGNKIIRFSFAPFSIENKIGGILVVMHDITNQQKLEHSRREFVANVSHELRTPLTTIKSYAETLMDMPTDTQTQNHFLGTIANEADRMTRIVKDLLTLSRLDEGQYELRPFESINLPDFVSGIVERMFFSAKEKHQTIKYINTGGSSYIMSDKDKLEQVVINIISNAIKYTPENGQIEVYSGSLYHDAFIKVRDNGIGIPKENLPRIFERFYRVDKARSRETGGTGLGLAIAKQIMNQLGGNITINSTEGEGTEVIISIPL